MEDFNEKLNKFASIVLQDANEERDRLVDETEDKYKTIIAEKENEYLREAYDLIQKAKTDARKMAGEELMQAEMEAKRKLLLKREEIINNVMSAVKEKLMSFKKSDEYENWLKKRAESALFEAGSGKKTVYISGDDMKYKNLIENIAEDITVEGASDRGFPGGLRVYNTDKGISVDYSFREMFEEEKQAFLQSSGLAIR